MKRHVLIQPFAALRRPIGLLGCIEKSNQTHPHPHNYCNPAAHAPRVNNYVNIIPNHSIHYLSVRREPVRVMDNIFKR